MAAVHSAEYGWAVSVDVLPASTLAHAALVPLVADVAYRWCLRSVKSPYHLKVTTTALSGICKYALWYPHTVSIQNIAGTMRHYTALTSMWLGVPGSSLLAMPPNQLLLGWASFGSAVLACTGKEAGSNAA